MLKLSQRKIPSKTEDKRKKIYKLKGGQKVSILRIYSIKQRGNVVNIFRYGKKIRSFPNNVMTEAIEKYITKYEIALQEKKKKQKKLLKDYCGASISICSEFENCNECNGNHKEWALERKRKKEKIVKPSVEDISEERTTLSPIRSKKMSFERSHSWKW